MLETNTVTTVHQRLRDEHGLGVGITAFREYVRQAFPEELLPGGQDEHGSGAHDEHESRPAVTIVSVRGAHAVGTVERLGRAEMVAGTWISPLERASRAGRPS